MLDKTSYTPMSKQIYDIVCSRIISTEYEIGKVLPTQEQFMQEFDVSRITIRQVFYDLKSRGIVSSKRGKRAYVDGIPSTYQGLHSEKGLTVDTKLSISSLETKILNIDKSCEYYPAKQVLLLEQANSILINRLRIVNSVKASLEFSYLNTTMFSEVDWVDGLENNFSLYELIKHKHGYQIERAEEKISPIIPTKKIQEIIGITEMPILFIQRSTYIKNHQVPLEYCEYYVLPEYYGKIVFITSKP